MNTGIFVLIIVNDNQVFLGIINYNLVPVYTLISPIIDLMQENDINFGLATDPSEFSNRDESIIPFSFTNKVISLITNNKMKESQMKESQMKESQMKEMELLQKESQMNEINVAKEINKDKLLIALKKRDDAIKYWNEIGYKHPTKIGWDKTELAMKEFERIKKESEKFN